MSYHDPMTPSRVRALEAVAAGRVKRRTTTGRWSGRTQDSIDPRPYQWLLDQGYVELDHERNGVRRAFLTDQGWEAVHG